MVSVCPSAEAGFDRKLVVGVGSLAVSNSQRVVLTTYSLGSCLGVTAYDPVARTGGLLHAMLPEGSLNPEKAASQPAMFVDSGMAAMLRATYELRAERQRVQICVAGGAQFLDDSGFFNIGQRNYHALLAVLDQHGLNARAIAVGGLVSRTMHLDLETGEVRLRISGESQDTILFPG